MAISAILNLILNLHTCARKKANCLYASLTFYNCNKPHINDALLSYETADTVFSPKNVPNKASTPTRLIKKCSLLLRQNALVYPVNLVGIIH